MRTEKAFLVLLMTLALCSCKEDGKTAELTTEAAVMENINKFVPDAYINDDNVRLRAEPNLNSDVITLLDAETSLMVISQSGKVRTIDEKGKIWYQALLENGTEGWVYGDYVSFFEKEQIVFDYSSVIGVYNLKKSGIEKVSDISQIIKKLSPEQMIKIGRLGITESSIVSFKGIEKLPNLQTIIISFSKISGLHEIEKMTSLEWLMFEECEIDDISKIGDFQNLHYFSLAGSSVDNLENISLPENLATINLSAFSQYKTMLHKLPEGIKQIYLEYNNITSCGDFEILKSKYDKLTDIYIRGNKIERDILRKEAQNWLPIVLNWEENNFLEPSDFIIEK
jgi:Leucine-rich repeat (LRR) protein